MSDETPRTEGQGGVRTAQLQYQQELAGDSVVAELPTAARGSLRGWVQGILGRARADDRTRREMLAAVEFLEERAGGDNPDEGAVAVRDGVIALIRDAHSSRTVPELTVCLGDGYGWEPDGDGYVIILPDERGAYCPHDKPPHC